MRACQRRSFSLFHTKRGRSGKQRRKKREWKRLNFKLLVIFNFFNLFLSFFCCKANLGEERLRTAKQQLPLLLSES